MKAQLFSAVAVAAVALSVAHTADAQSIDYGSLQQLFNEPVTTSATGAPLRSTEAPVDMTIITAEDIKRSGVFDIPTILSRVAGIDILNWNAGNSDVGVRGYDQVSSPRLLVLINGQQVYLDYYGYTDWRTLPVSLSEIRQIEVVRGPNSALFGFNAVGGVVNIITYNPKYDDTNSADVHGGTQNDVGGSVVTTQHLGDKVSIRLSAGGERQDSWSNTENYAPVWQVHGMLNAVAQLAPNTEFRVQGGWTRSGEEDAAALGGYVYEVFTTKSLMGTLTSDTPYGELQVQGYVNGMQARTPSIGDDTKNQVEVASIQDLLKIGTRSTFRFALEYRNNIIDTSPINTGNVDYGVISPSAMWTFVATQKLSLTVAGRVDSLSLHHSGTILPGFQPSSVSDWNRNITAFSANLGAVYKLTGLDTLRATYARGNQVPSLINLGGVQFPEGPAPNGINIGGNPDLQPSVVTNYELSYDRNLPPLGASVSGKVFYQQTTDLIGQWDFTAPDYAATATSNAGVVYQNAGNSNMAGFELSAKGKFQGGFHWSADTTYTNVTDKAIGDYNLINRQIDFAATSPKYRGNLALGWTDNHWTVDGFLHYVTRYDLYGNGGLLSTPPYATLGGRIAYLLPGGLEAALSGQNLTTKHQIQAGEVYLRAPRIVMLGLSKAW